jgi:hypothetical protein
MDWSLALGVGGIVVSIAVGWLTYFFADKKQRRNRYIAAKNTIAATLSRSLSESNVPSYELVAATIRSVLREDSPSNLDSVTVDEISDDLIRQVSSDPFLAAERRRELQQGLLSISGTNRKLAAVESSETSDEGERTGLWFFSSSGLSLLVGLATALVTWFSFAYFRLRPERPLPVGDLAANLRAIEIMRLAESSRQQRHLFDYLPGSFPDAMLVLVIGLLLTVLVGHYFDRRT